MPIGRFSFLNRIVVSLLLPLMFCAVCRADDLPATLDEAINRLDKALPLRYEKVARRFARIDSMRDVVESVGGVKNADLSVVETIGVEYSSLNIDSALSVFDAGYKAALERGDSATAVRFRLRMARIYPLKSIVKETINIYESIDALELDSAERRLYYDSGRFSYVLMASMYSSTEFAGEYFERACLFNDSLMTLIGENDSIYKLYLGTDYLNKKQYSLSIAALNDLLETLEMDNAVFPETALLLSANYSARGRAEQALYYTALVAISDIECGYLSSEALRRLGTGLYSRGDNKHAHKYLLASQENIANSGAVMRSSLVAKSLPMIVGTHRGEEQRFTRMLIIIIACLVLILALIFVIMYNHYKSMKRLRMMKDNLEQANQIKEVYIGRLLSLCSICMDKLDDFNRIVGRKIVAGQVDELLSMVKSGKMSDEYSHQFYEVFDDAFVNIYPTFVDDVNKLLEPDKAISLSEDGHLPPELRIIALMRLGLDDSAQMARFLGLSLNTVYTYRNRIKSRARNRDTFDSDIMNIGILS